jgi:hypothetical protein
LRPALGVRIAPCYQRPGWAASRPPASLPMLLNVAESAQAGVPGGASLRTRQHAVQRRAEALPGVKLRQRSGRYWLDGIEGNVVAISPPMTLDEVERELTRLTSEHVDGCQG